MPKYVIGTVVDTNVKKFGKNPNRMHNKYADLKKQAPETMIT